jgi:hypothetical protein
MLTIMAAIMAGLAAFTTSAHNLRKKTSSAISTNEQLSAITAISQLAEKYDCMTGEFESKSLAKRCNSRVNLIQKESSMFCSIKLSTMFPL